MSTKRPHDYYETLVVLATNWFFGVIFFMAGFNSLISGSLWIGLSMALIASLLLPPVRNFAYSKTNKELSMLARSVAIFTLIIAAFIFSGQNADREKKEIAAQELQAMAQKAAARQQQNVDYFGKNSSKILNDAKVAFKSGNFKEVISLSSIYLAAQNKELNDLSTKASFELAAIERAEKEAKEKAERAIKEANENAERAEKTKEILAQLGSLQSWDYKNNRDLYQQLVTYNPNVEEYKKELYLFSAKVTEQDRDGNKMIETCADAMTIEKKRCEQASVGGEFTFNGKVYDVLTPYNAKVLLRTREGNYANVVFRGAEAEELRKDEHIKFAGTLKSVGTGIIIKHEIEDAVMVR